MNRYAVVQIEDLERAQGLELLRAEQRRIECGDGVGRLVAAPPRPRRRGGEGEEGEEEGEAFHRVEGVEEVERVEGV